jgi:hypothetical protein
MIDDQLAAAAEQVSQRFLAGRAVEHVVLLDLDPWQFAALRAEPVARAGQLLFMREKRPARGGPLFA